MEGDDPSTRIILFPCKESLPLICKVPRDVFTRYSERTQDNNKTVDKEDAHLAPMHLVNLCMQLGLQL